MGLKILIIDEGERDLNIFKRVSHNVLYHEGEPVGEIEPSGKELIIGDGESAMILIEASWKDADNGRTRRTILVDDFMVVGALGGGRVVVHDEEEQEHLFEVPAGKRFSIFKINERLEGLIKPPPPSSIPSHILQALGLPPDEPLIAIPRNDFELYRVVIAGF